MSADICPECGGPRHFGWGGYVGDTPPDFSDPNQGPPKCYRCTAGYTKAKIARKAHEAQRGIRKIPGMK